MGFVTLEDIQGNIELVLFPRTWEKTREQLIMGQIIIAEGKVDTSNTPPKILVDNIRTEIKMTVAADEVALESPATDSLASAGTAVKGSVFASDYAAPISPAGALYGMRAVAGKTLAEARTAERAGAYAERSINNNATVASGKMHPGEHAADDWGAEDMPPPPDNFPAGWETEWQPSFDNAALAARPEPRPEDKPVNQPPYASPAKTIELDPASSTPVAVETPAPKALPNAVAVAPTIPAVEPVMQEPPILPSLYVPVAQADQGKDRPPRQITVMLRSMEDKDRDKLRIKTLFGTLISFHGRDRFSFQIFEGGKGHLIDFPNDTTRICPEMLARLQKLVGEESWRVEEIQ